MRLALFQPEIPQNVGTLLRFCSCMGINIEIIEPCGFIFTDKKLKRAGMDYIGLADIHRHASWEEFYSKFSTSRLIAVTPHTQISFTDFNFDSNDILIMGQESIGFPQEILEQCHAKISIPMVPIRRSLNVALAAAIVTTEALRQTNQLPPLS